MYQKRIRWNDYTSWLPATFRQRIGWLLLLCLALMLASWMLDGYLPSDPTFVAGLVVLALSMVVRSPGVGSWRFAVWAMLCFVAGLVIPARSFHFLTLLFAAGFIVENLKGKINEAPVLIAVLLSAVFKTMSIVLGFAIRLQMSANAAAALVLLGFDAQASGNMIRLNGQDFAVDPACMGLQMVDISFLYGFFLLGLMERRSGKRLHWWALAATIVGLGGLNLIFNQLRIIFLVLFKIPADSPMHDLVGLAGLALYVLAPAWFGIRWLFQHASFPAGDRQPIWKQFPVQITASSLVLVACTGWLVLYQTSGIPQHNQGARAVAPRGISPDCPSEILADGVVKYAPDQWLVYVKPIRGFYSTEHTPLICWQGSGYTFGRVWEQEVNGKRCYAGTLKKEGNPLLYTAWWFDNGRTQTISQVYWRWLDMGGAPDFSLINVTASDSTTLRRQLEAMLY